MAARIAELEAQLTLADPARIKAVLDDGVGRTGKRYCHIALKGGPFGNWGVKLKAHWWEDFKKSIPIIDAAFAEHAETIQAYYASLPKK